MQVRLEQDEGEGTGIQMAPLIDCVFLLLIFFLVAATLQKPHLEQPIRLAHAAATKKKIVEPTTLIIELAHDGNIYIDGQQMTKRLLRKRLRQAKEEAPDRRVRIDSDRQTAFQHIVYLVDVLQFEGLNHVGFRVRAEEWERR